MDGRALVRLPRCILISRFGRMCSRNLASGKRCAMLLVVSVVCCGFWFPDLAGRDRKPSVTMQILGGTVRFLFSRPVGVPEVWVDRVCVGWFESKPDLGSHWTAREGGFYTKYCNFSSTPSEAEGSYIPDLPSDGALVGPVEQLILTPQSPVIEGVIVTPRGRVISAYKPMPGPRKRGGAARLPSDAFYQITACRVPFKDDYFTSILYYSGSEWVAVEDLNLRKNIEVKSLGRDWRSYVKARRPNMEKQH